MSDLKAMAESEIVELWGKFAVFGGPQVPFMLLPGFRQAVQCALAAQQAEHEAEVAILREGRESDLRAAKSLGERIIKLGTERDAAVAAVENRDRDWILAMGHALGLDSGYEVPIVPEPEPFKRLFAALSPAAGEKVLVDKVFAFADLKKDWNSYGADPFPPETIQLAVKVARWLGDQWKVVPCADNSIMFYFGNEEKMIEVRTDYAAAKETP